MYGVQEGNCHIRQKELHIIHERMEVKTPCPENYDRQTSQQKNMRVYRSVLLPIK